MTRPVLPPAITADRLVAIARGLDPVRLAAVIPALLSGGVRVVEITLDSPGALESIATWSSPQGDGAAVIGAGTVLRLDEAVAAVAAGAHFLVAPHTDPEIIGWAAAHDVPFLAGGITPTEVVTAWNAGAAAVKVFPARIGGPDHLSDLRGPLGHIPLVPTGGVSADNAAAYLAAGAVAVGLGSWLTGADDIDEILRRAVAATRVCRPDSPTQA